ncbi:MAG TPA: hypothetical protein VGZ25_02900, partial [Gemmataceae bacterium]|nr:hypothetical protein [Gemmataceae bacterium]
METVGLIILIIGYIIGIVGGLMLLVLAFQESALWGLGCLFVPFVSIIFIIMYWDDAKNAFFISLGGSALIVLGTLLHGE